MAKKSKAKNTTKTTVKTAFTPGAGSELVFGLVGLVGTDLQAVEKALAESLAKVSYKTFPIKLSDLMVSMEVAPNIQGLEKISTEQRIEKLMDAGNSFRQQWRHGNAVALLGINRIWEIRAQHWQKRGGEEKGDQPIPNTAYVLTSLKHPGEVETLREIYGDAFILISAYEPKEHRINRLINRIADSNEKIVKRTPHSKKKLYEGFANKLAEKDEKEIDKDFGQSVRDIFHQADLFISKTYEKTVGSSINGQIDRFIKLLFGAPFITPTQDEYGIFHAHSVALKSADLSRQVGAIILTDRGEVVSAGCNEVPSVGGPPYWEGDNNERPDTRDFVKGFDTSAAMKHEIIGEIFLELKKAGWLKKKYSILEEEDLCEKALYEDAFLKESRVASIIEFGRIVHAEMSAITDAARRGLAVKGTTLYCTTFPCHMCARHLLASGVKKVIFVEPYPKSMTQELYEGLAKIDGDSKAYPNAVIFDPFIGVSPNRFFALFSMANTKKSFKKERKDKKTGKALDVNKLRDAPTLQNINPFYIKWESKYMISLNEYLGKRKNPAGGKRNKPN